EPRLRRGSLAWQAVCGRPDRPALRPERGPELGGAVPAQVELAGTGCAVGSLDCRPASIACLFHLRAPLSAYAASWRAHRIRAAAASGWSPNSCAIRAAQPRGPSRRIADMIAPVIMSGVGVSEGCSAETNSASLADRCVGSGGVLPCMSHRLPPSPGHV